nr:MAG TPA: hypothetical protein [Caudoviricetes sp.]
MGRLPGSRRRGSRPRPDDRPLRRDPGAEGFLDVHGEIDGGGGGLAPL